jgi:hypothetical protein
MAITRIVPVNLKELPIEAAHEKTTKTPWQLLSTVDGP